jgi:hypothetical protein
MRRQIMNFHKTLSILVLGISLCFGQTVLGQDPAAKLVMPDSIFDFGFFATDARVVHTYPIYNQGNDTLRIIKVKPGCGCTTAPLHNYDIPPGDSTTLDMYFDSKRLTGLVKKKTTILSNDPVTPFKEIAFIAVTGKKHPYVRPQPEVINFGRLSAGKIDKVYSTTLTNVTDAAVKLEIIDLSENYLDAELVRDTLEPGESTELKITLRRIPNDPNLYNFSATLGVKIKDVNIHLSIPAVGRLNRID